MVEDAFIHRRNRPNLAPRRITDYTVRAHVDSGAIEGYTRLRYALIRPSPGSIPEERPTGLIRTGRVGPYILHYQ